MPTFHPSTCAAADRNSAQSSRRTDADIAGRVLAGVDGGACANAATTPAMASIARTLTSHLRAHGARNLEPPGTTHHTRQLAISCFVIHEHFFHRVPFKFPSHPDSDVAHLADHFIVSAHFHRTHIGLAGTNGIEEVLRMIVAAQDTNVAGTEHSAYQRFRMSSHAGAAYPDPSFRADQNEADTYAADTLAKLKLRETLAGRYQIHQQHADAVGILVLDLVGRERIANIVIHLASPLHANRRRVVGIVGPLPDVDVVDSVLASDAAEAVVGDRHPSARDAQITVRRPRRRPEPHVPIHARWDFGRLLSGHLREPETERQRALAASRRADGDGLELADPPVADQLDRK